MLRKEKMRKRRLYLRGKIIEASQAKLPVVDSGFMFGDSVTESTRTFSLKPFKLDEHLERLYQSLKATRIDPGMPLSKMKELTLQVLETNFPIFEPNDDAWILHNVSRGIFPEFRVEFEDYPDATVHIDCYPIDFAGFAKYYEAGVHAVVPSTRQLPPQCIDPKIKHRSRLHFRLAENEAKLVDPEAFPLLLDLAGNVTEGLGANFFVVKGGILYTPPARDVLAGVSRATVLELADKLDISSREEEIQLYDVYSADEAFFTSTPYCLLPATRINGLPIGTGKPGPIVQKLLHTWSEMSGVDVVAQALDHLEPR